MVGDEVDAGLKDEHAVPVAIEAIAIFNSALVSFKCEFFSC